MPEPKVQTSSHLFSEEVAMANASDPESAIEAALPPVVYEFAGGRVRKREGNGPYTPTVG